VRHIRFAFAAIIAAIVFPAESQAQSAQAISLQVSALFNGVEGAVFSGLKNGFGGEAQIRYTPGALSVGAGFQYTEHGRRLPPDAPPNTPEPPGIRLYGGFIEPRYRIHTGSYVVAPYVAARLSLAKAGFEGGDLSLSSTFMQLNGGGGLLYRLGPRFNLDVGATFGYNRRSSGTLRSGDEEVIDPITGRNAADEPASGTNLVVRVGLAVGIGG
jgi:Outer membrane protein beta-barrel domain